MKSALETLNRHDSLSVETLISVVFVPRFALISLFSCSFWMNFCYFSGFLCFSESCLVNMIIIINGLQLGVN